MNLIIIKFKILNFVNIYIYKVNGLTFYNLRMFFQIESIIYISLVEGKYIKRR